jgi:DNA replication protein DnaC
VLSAEVSSREASGTELRFRLAAFPTRKSLEELNSKHQPSLSPQLLAHLATGTYLAQGSNVVLLGPPGTGKIRLTIGVGIRAASQAHRVPFASAIERVMRLQKATSRDASAMSSAVLAATRAMGRPMPRAA